MKIVGKNKYGELVNLELRKSDYLVTVEPVEKDEKKSKKEEEFGFGKYSNSFNKLNEVEVCGIKRLSQNQTEVELKFASERRSFVFIVDMTYIDVCDFFMEK